MPEPNDGGNTEDGSGAPLTKFGGSLDDTMLPQNITGQSTIILSGQEVCGTEVDLDENAYGCAAVALVRGITSLHGGFNLLTFVRIFISLGLMAFNLYLQFTLLGYISTYVVEPAVRDVQKKYTDFHASVFDDEGNIIHDDWQAYPYRKELCEIAMADPVFYYIILLLWTLRILDEVRKIFRFVDEVTTMPACATAQEQLEFTDTKDPELQAGRCLITRLTFTCRMLLLFIIAIPRCFIAFYLLTLGCRWLSASANFANMVLNALALVFVTDIDELLYESVLPMVLKKQIADTNWFFTEDPKTKGEVEHTEWMLFRRTLFFLIAMIIFLGVYGMYFQSVLPYGAPGIMQHCQATQMKAETPKCSIMTFSSDIAACYPFGLSS